MADGAADSVSALLATAVRRYLDQLADDRMTAQAARLDAEIERALINRVRDDDPQPGWERLT